MDCRWSSSPSGRYGLGAWGQGWWLLLLLLVHLLEVLLPGSHLCILQLLHVEGLSVGQELLPLIFQLPAATGNCYPGPRRPLWQPPRLPLPLLKDPLSHAHVSPRLNHVRLRPATLLLTALELIWYGLGSLQFQSSEFVITLI